MNIFKKIRLFDEYKKIIKSKRVDLEGSFNLRIDRAQRLYTVLNIPEELFGEPYNIRKSDIDTISQTYIKEYVTRLSTYLNSIGLTELYDFYEPIKKVDKYSYLLIMGFKPMNSTNYNKIIYYRILPVSILISLTILLYFIFK
jgi:hypothetical protein